MSERIFCSKMISSAEYFQKGSRSWYSEILWRPLEQGGDNETAVTVRRLRLLTVQHGLGPVANGRSNVASARAGVLGPDLKSAEQSPPPPSPAPEFALRARRRSGGSCRLQLLAPSPRISAEIRPFPAQPQSLCRVQPGAREAARPGVRSPARWTQFPCRRARTDPAASRPIPHHHCLPGAPVRDSFF
jgi:hypothetical protein